MVFNSIDFFLFFPIVVLIYYTIPTKFRYIWLLVISYFYYCSWDIKYIFYLVPITFITYLSGIAIDFANQGVFLSSHKNIVKKSILVINVVMVIGLLCVLKYLDFFIINLNRMLGLWGISIKNPTWNLLLPIGISFYTLQSLGYLIDIYRSKQPAEKNVLRYALFISFFPIVMSGPIERAGNLLKQLNSEIRLNTKNIRYGLLSLAYGLYLKLVVADNLKMLVDNVLLDWNSRYGCEIILAVILFGIQIYCDFNGYSQMAIGTAKILGIDIINNFSAPYLAENIKDFWHRWHISLTSWFTNYVYIPLGGNRKGVLKKYVNTLIVFGISGLWHGAGLNFIVWGLLNGIYLIIYDLYINFNKKRISCGRRQNQCLIFRIGESLLTFVAVDFAWFFFVMADLGDAIDAIYHSATNFYANCTFLTLIYNLFQNKKNIIILLISLIVMLIIDINEYQHNDFREILFRQNKAFRWLFYLFLVFMILIFGTYGGEYAQKSFIYFNF